MERGRAPTLHRPRLCRTRGAIRAGLVVVAFGGVSLTTKLVLVEGLPGTGKSSTARYIADALSGAGQEVLLFNEGNLSHPADFEGVAFLPLAVWKRILRSYPQHAQLLQDGSDPQAAGRLVPYLRLHREHTLPDPLLGDLEPYDVYGAEQSAETFRALLLERWRLFAASRRDADGIVVFECCFLQNPMCALFVQRDEGPATVRPFILDLASAVADLHPKLVYLHQQDVAATIAHVLPERSEAWKDFVVSYHTKQGYGKSRGLQGVSGYVEVLQRRREMELEIVADLPMETLSIDTSGGDWESCRTRAVDFVSST